MENLPVITLGMTTYNCAWSLLPCLDALEKIDYPKDRMRIVFVDNNSEDETPEILRDFQKRFGSVYESVTIISERSNIPEARNICINNSIGEYILFIDSDVIAPPDTIRRTLELFASNPRICIVGFPYWYGSMAFLQGMILSKQRRSPYTMTMTKMGCTMIKKELFNKIGLFDSKYEIFEDMDLSVRASEAGYVIILDPTRTPIHLTREKPSGILQQIIRYCIGVFKRGAHYYFMTLREYKPRWLINRLIFYSTMAASITLAIASVITGSLLLIFPFIACYSVAFAYHFPKASGKWRLINSLLFPLFGIFLALGILKETARYYLLGRVLKGRRKL